MTIENIIKAESKKLGFNLCGITLSQTPPHYSHFLDWVKMGFHSGMEYLSKQESLLFRGSPDEFWPGCKSIIVLATSYPNSSTSFYLNDPAGTIASYAWQEDYHLFLPKILSELAENIKKRSAVSFDYKVISDSSPILERDFAQLAGLGWIGKNTNLISPEYGSFFILSEILLNIELIPDQPFSKDFCGSCTKCLDSCPTNSLKSGRILDSNSCISYLTIENKGSIPLALRKKIGKNVFGCDICQAICPWNKKAKFSNNLDNHQGPYILSEEEILTDLQLTPQGFNKKFKTSPIKRAKRRGYLRNLCVAAGNSKNPVYVPVLSSLLEKETESLIREHAAWALGEIGIQEAIALLSNRLSIESEVSVRKEIKQALSKQINH